MHNPDSKKSCAIIYKGCVFVQRVEGSTKYFEDAPFIPNRDNICSFYCYLKGVSKHVKALTISKQLKTTVLLNINKTSCKKGMSKNWGWLSTLLKDWTLLTSSSILFKSITASCRCEVSGCMFLTLQSCLCLTC